MPLTAPAVRPAVDARTGTGATPAHWFAPEYLDRLRLTPGPAGLNRRHAAGRGGATGRCTRARC
jgi:hypothetical protein